MFVRRPKNCCARNVPNPSVAVLQMSRNQKKGSVLVSSAISMIHFAFEME